MRLPSPLRPPLIASIALHAALLGLVATGIPERSEQGTTLVELDLIAPGEAEGPPAPSPVDPVPVPAPAKPSPPAEPIAEPIPKAPPPEPPPARPAPVARSSPPRPEKPVRRAKPAGPPSAPSPTAIGTAQAQSTPEPPRGTAEDDASVASEYLRKLRARLERARVYPIEARDRGWSGTASVRFVIGRDGGVEKLELATGSGRRLLDEAALETVRRASPFPALPPEIKRETLDLTLPVAFRLDDD